MSDIRDLSTVTIPLALTAHSQAKGFQQRHSTPAVQKRVYLNTLAVYAVATYLETLGYDADLERSYSYDPAQQTLLDVADLLVTQVGRLECRVVLPGETAIAIPADVICDRVGYIGVQLNASLRQATLLGFIDTLPALTGDALSVPLSELRPLADLGAYLEQCAAEPMPVQLNRWLQDVTTAGWQALSDALTELAVSSPSFAFRGSSQSAETEFQPVPEIGQVKPLRLGEGAAATTVNLLVGLIPQDQDNIEIWVQVRSAGDQPHLPSALQLRVLDEADTVVMQAEARQTEAIQLKFEAEPGERFSVQVSWRDRTLTEVFQV